MVEISMSKIGLKGEQVFKELVMPAKYHEFTLKELDSRIAHLQEQVDKFTVLLDEAKAKRESVLKLVE